jgi:hypothetical protein
MWRWLNNNSSAIQALASIAVLLVTAQLARLTARYVSLTKSIANTAAEQIGIIKENASAHLARSRDSMRTLAMRSRYSLETLDRVAPRHRQLAEFSGVTEADVQSLESHARDIGGTIMQLSTARAAISIRSVLGARARAAAVNYTTGWSAGEQESKEYASSIAAALESLKNIENVCEKPDSDFTRILT